MGVVGEQRQAVATLPTRKRPSTHYRGGWVGPRADLDGVENVASTGLHPQTIQPLASCCTDYTIQADFVFQVHTKMSVKCLIIFV